MRREIRHAVRHQVTVGCDGHLFFSMLKLSPSTQSPIG